MSPGSILKILERTFVYSVLFSKSEKGSSGLGTGKFRLSIQGYIRTFVEIRLPVSANAKVCRNQFFVPYNCLKKDG